jgi:hypothetical protein
VKSSLNLFLVKSFDISCLSNKEINDFIETLV